MIFHAFNIAVYELLCDIQIQNSLLYILKGISEAAGGEMILNSLRIKAGIAILPRLLQKVLKGIMKIGTKNQFRNQANRVHAKGTKGICDPELGLENCSLPKLKIRKRV